MKNLLFRRLIISIAVGILWFMWYHAYSIDLSEIPLPTTWFFMTWKMNYVPWEVLVKYKTPNRAWTNWINVSSLNSVKSLSTSLSKQNLSIDDTIIEGNIAIISIQDEKTVEETIALLENDKNVEYAEPNYIYYLYDINANDPRRWELRWLDNKGQYISWPYWAYYWSSWEDIDWVRAYQVFSGSFSTSSTWILVGVIDEWVNYNHEDLRDNMRSSIWYDFLNNDPNPLPSIWTHWTHVAWTIAATMNNWKWIIWVNPNAKIMSLKVSDESWMPTKYVINAIDYATNNWVKIINASWGWPSYSSWIYEAIKRFKNAWWLFITAAWNTWGGNNNDVKPEYPCAYDLDNIICVAATTQTWWLASFSHYWRTSVDVWAPWTNILSTVTQENYENAIFFQENFDYYNSTGELYDEWYTWWWSWEPILYGGFLIFYDWFAPNWTYLDSPTRDVSFNGDYEIQIGSISLCENNIWNGYLELQVKTGASWQVIPQYKENIDKYERIEYNANIWKASSFQFRFYFHDNTSQTWFTCYVNAVDLTVYRDYDWPNNLYDYLNGTSMATPHVAWLASLAWSFRPDLTYTGIKQAIMENWDDLPSLSNKTVSWKRINAYKTLVALDNYAPASPILLSPASWYQYTWFDTTLQVLFQWSGSHDTWVGVSWYTFELSNNSGFNSLLTWITLDNTWLSFDITSTWMYYWRVKAFDKKWNTWEYSDIYPFSVEKSSCSFNWTIINHWDSITGYKNEAVQTWLTCEFEIRTCTNWTLSWTFEYSSCVVLDDGDCFFSGSIVNTWVVVHSWEFITWYQSVTVPFGSGCVSEIRTCVNWELSWSFPYWNCTVEDPLPCTFSGNTVDHWESVTGYKSGTVPYWESCESETRTCINWTLSWSFQYWSCSVEPGASCTFNWNTINHWSSVTWYRTSVVPYWQTCESETRTCINWILSWSFIYSSCVVQPNGWGWGWWGGGWDDNHQEPKIPTIIEKVLDSINSEEEEEEEEEIELDPKEILKNWYTREMNDAYEFAFENWITTRKSINQANMTWSLTRIAMAKMLSQYAINVLWKTLNTDNLRNCNFPDVTKNMDSNYDNWVTLACQLWIMWVWITNFRPNENVTRAQFGTALSRMLYVLADGKDHYYSTHLSKLKQEWIISNDSPTLEEVRWYVMLMLMRSAE